MTATTEYMRQRQRAEDARRLAQWKSDAEVRPQIERSIAARDERWKREDEEAEVEERVRGQILEENAEARLRERVLRELGRDAELVG